MSARRGNRIASLISRICLSGLSLLVLFVVCELSANLYLHRMASDDEFRQYASVRQLKTRAESSKAQYSLHHYLTYFPTPGYRQGPNRHNSLGFRGDEIAIPKPDGEYRIVCLGGSTTYTSGVDDYQKAWPYQLQQNLHAQGYKQVTVVNAGASGWNTWESLINLQFRVLDVEPNLVIVYHAVNDVHPRLIWPLDNYQGDNSGRRRIARSAVLMPSVLEHSTALRMLMVRTGQVAPHSSMDRTVGEKPEAYRGHEFLGQQASGHYPQGVFKTMSASEMFAANPPIYFERNLRNIVAVARNMGVDVVMSSFAYSPLFETEPVVASAEYQAALNEHNAVTQSVATSMKVPFFDFAAKFPVDREYYTDGRHTNETGAKLKAELFADYLRENSLIPGGSADSDTPDRLASESDTTSNRQ